MSSFFRPRHSINRVTCKSNNLDEHVMINWIDCVLYLHIKSFGAVKLGTNIVILLLTLAMLNKLRCHAHF